MKRLISLFTVLLTVLFAVQGQYLSAILTFSLVGYALTRPTERLCVTLISGEILNDVLQAFKVALPGINLMGTDFRTDSLKLNQSYTAHIPTIPTATDVSTTYNTGLNSARGLLVDVPITVSKHKAVPLYWSHFDAIKDKKNTYDQVIQLAAYALAKEVIDDIFSGFNTQNFSQSTTSASADFDYDVLSRLTGSLNTQNALPVGRGLFVPTTVANVLDKDTRVASRDFYGQQTGGNGIRKWQNIGGFSEVIEYPGFPTNNGSGLSVTAATSDVFTSAAHGYSDGDPVVFSSLDGSGVGITAATKYYVRDATTNTFKVSATVGGAAVDVTTAYASGTVTKTENLNGFAFDMRAIALLAGIPDNFDQEFLGSLNIPRTMGFESITDPETGLSMAAVSWQEVGTGKLVWAPTLVWGKAMGRQSAANAAGSKTDYAGHRVISA